MGGFKDIIGHEDTIQHLQNAIKKNVARKKNMASMDFMDSDQDAMLNGDFHQCLESHHVTLINIKNVNVNVVK